jgi:hypothetical protein
MHLMYKYDTMKRRNTCIILLTLLVALLSCSKEKQTETIKVAENKDTIATYDLHKMIGTYSFFDKNWNLMEYTIFEKDSVYYARISYNKKTNITPLLLENTNTNLYSFEYEGKVYYLRIDASLAQNKTIRILNEKEERFLNFFEGKGFIDVKQQEHIRNQKLRNALDVATFSSAIRPEKNNWSGYVNYTDTLLYMAFDDSNSPMRAIFLTNNKDTVRLTFDIPIGTEFIGTTMELRWKIDTVVVNKLPMLNQKLLHYRVVR